MSTKSILVASWGLLVLDVDKSAPLSICPLAGVLAASPGDMDMVRDAISAVNMAVKDIVVSEVMLTSIQPKGHVGY